MEEPKNKKGLKFEIQADEETAMGKYSNFVIINASETDFALDFVYAPPQSRKAKLRSRVILSPVHVKRMMMLLQKQVQTYEKKFGEIPLSRYKLDEPYPEKGGSSEGNVH